MSRDQFYDPRFRKALENELQQRGDVKRLKTLELLILCESGNVDAVRDFISRNSNSLNLNSGQMNRARHLSDPEDLEDLKGNLIELLQGDTLQEEAGSSPGGCPCF